MKFLVLILRNMRRQARRSILTILTIAIATLVFAMLVSVPTSMDRIVDRVSKNQRLFVINRAGPWDIPAKYCLDIKKLAHVKGCAADLDEFMHYRNDSDWIGMSAADVELLDLNPLGSAAEAIARFKADKRSVVVGYEAMRRYGWHVGQQIMLRNTWNGHPVSMPFIIQAVVPDETYPNLFLLRRGSFVVTYKNAAGRNTPNHASRVLRRPGLP